MKKISHYVWGIPTGLGVLLLVLALGSFQNTVAEPTPEVIIYFSASWGCCDGWGSHLEENGFKVKRVTSANQYAVKRQYRIPRNLYSCHTGIVEGYVIEGHIPASDIKRLLEEKPDIRGLVVPGMPGGSPGMESSPYEPYTVFALQHDGSIKEFSRH